MCIRDRIEPLLDNNPDHFEDVFFVDDIRNNINTNEENKKTCLLYTSDAADERSSVDLGGRRIIKKKRH